jgi:hypothetical protein
MDGFELIANMNKQSCGLFFQQLNVHRQRMMITTKPTRCYLYIFPGLKYHD